MEVGPWEHAALAVQQALPDELGDVAIDWRRWSKAIHSEMMKLVRYQQLPPQVRRDFLDAAATVPAGNSLSWRWRTWRLAWQGWLQRDASDGESLADVPVVTDDAIEFPGRIVGEPDRFESIVDVPAWLEDAAAGAIGSLAVHANANR